MKFPFDEVEGLLAPWDKSNLRTLANWAGKTSGEYMEIGSLNGLSALCIMSGMPPGRTMHCYDWFEPDKLKAFQHNLLKAGQIGQAVVHAGDFNATLTVTPPFAFAFVDHDHSLENTRTAYQRIWPKLNIGGILAFHDFGHPDYPGGTDFIKTLPHDPILEDRGIIAFQR